MQEHYFFIAGAVFQVTLSLAAARFGHRHGGVVWAGAWGCLYLGGIVGAILPIYPALEPLLPLTGTAFAALLVGGTYIFTGRSKRIPRSVVFAGTGICAVRLMAQPFISFGESQALGALTITAAVAVSCLCFLKPKGRVASGWEKWLGYTFPAISAAAIYFAVVISSGDPSATPLLVWQLVGNSIAFIQVAAFVSLNSDRMDALRRQAEWSRDAHARAEKLYREVAEEASDMITEIDAKGLILYANPAHQNILGFDPGQIIGQRYDALIEKEPLDEGGVINSMPPDALFKPPHQRVYRVRHALGGTRILECNVRTFERAGEGNRLVITSRDATERHASERKLEEDRKQLESLVQERTVALEASLLQLQKTERLASIGTLAAGIAHQINNPIGSILIASELALDLEDSPEAPKARRAALENSVEQAKRCGRIVSDILKFARNEPTEKVEEDLAALVRRVHDQAKEQAESHGVMLDFEIATETLPVMGSAIALEQALLNVIQNSIESAGSASRVDVHAFGKDEGAYVIISDSGHGMDANQVEHAFDPFFTTRNGRGGTGLGLSVAHGVVTDHGGTIELESTPNIGTTTRISIPMLRKKVDAIPRR